MSAKSGSKFGMLKNLSATQEEAEKQKNIKAQKQSEPDLESAPQLKHYSTYMPADLYAQLQVFVVRQKRAAVRGGEKVSIANVIAESVRQYLEKHDK